MAATTSAKRAARQSPARRRSPVAARPGRPAAKAVATLTYGYCVVRGPQPDVAGGPPGLEGMAPPSALALGDDLWLIAAEAPATLYGPAAIEARAADLDWLSECALAHEAVIERQMSAPAVAPLKLFTLFSSPQAARRRLTAKRAALLATLRRLADAAEWGVRVHARPRPASSARAERPASGRGFLESKRDARRLAQEDLEATRARARRGFTTLGRLARDARQLPPPPGASPSLLLDAVFLVARPRQAAFETAFERLATELAALGAEVVFSGPWPAYHFADEAK